MMQCLCNNIGHGCHVIIVHRGMCDGMSGRRRHSILYLWVFVVLSYKNNSCMNTLFSLAGVILTKLNILIVLRHVTRLRVSGTNHFRVTQWPVINGTSSMLGPLFLGSVPNQKL